MVLRGRCKRHENEPGPSLGHDCCEVERLRALCRELERERNEARSRMAEMEFRARSWDAAVAASGMRNAVGREMGLLAKDGAAKDDLRRLLREASRALVGHPLRARIDAALAKEQSE